MGSQAQQGHVTLSNMYMNYKNDNRRAQIPATATGLILWFNEKVFSGEWTNMLNNWFDYHDSG